MKTNLIGDIALKVNDLNRSIRFYQDVLKMSLVSASKTMAHFENPSLTLIEVDNPLPANPSYTGLFHMAFLVPTEQDLANILHHFIRIRQPLDGAADHIYSQALYLHDPDGHGIEIYHDRPREEWIIHQDGSIEADTLPLNTKRLLALSNQEYTQLPGQTIMGHIHLSVLDLKKFEDFYTQLFKFEVKTRWYDQALFIAKDNYHHHIGANTWQKATLPLPSDTLGLEYFTLHLDTTTFQELGKIYPQLEITDPNGIKIRIRNN